MDIDYIYLVKAHTEMGRQAYVFVVAIHKPGLLVDTTLTLCHFPRQT